MKGWIFSREEFYEKLRKGADAPGDSQPSPESVMHMWSAMLQEYEELVYIPISSGLSGSCMTAQAMAQEEPYAGRVFVVDNGTRVYADAPFGSRCRGACRERIPCTEN